VRAALAQVLHQQAMVLQWAGMSAKADEVLARARPLAELVAASEPENVQRRVDLADVYLRSGEPRRTVEVLQRLASEELEGQVLATLAVAALLADQDEVLVEHRLDLEASDDPQAHWVMALWLVQQGKFKDAADILRAWTGRAAKAPVVWPLGRFDVLPLRSPAEVAAPLKAFVACQESALRRGEEDVSCFETLASGLESASSPP
jgi:thioredoxin-like negative regulator of GroEL